MSLEISTIKDIEALCSESLFQIIYTRYVGNLYKNAAKYVNREDAQDIVQELMIETWNKRHSITGNSDGSLQNYLFIRLKYKILDYYSKKSEQILWDEALPELIKLSVNYSHEKIILKELEHIISETVQEMRPSEREVFKLRWEEQLSVEETAKFLSISKKSVMNRFTEAMKVVRQNILKYYDEKPKTEYQLITLIIIISKIIR